MIRNAALPPATPSLVDQATAVTAGLRKMTRVMEEVTATAAPILQRIGSHLRWSMSSPERRQVILAGWEQRYYVRASMDPDVDAAELAFAICASRDPETAWMGPRERAVVAAAVLRGHVEHHPEAAAGDGVLAWHRLIGTTGVEVSRG